MVVKNIQRSRRQQKIMDLLTAKSEVTVAALTQQFQVTEMTVRRDLAALAEQGHVTRTYGGAILAAPAVAKFAFRERQQSQMLEKRAIALAALQMVEAGMTVVLDTGTTTLEVAKVIAGVPQLQVLTSSLAIASELFAQDNLELVLLGGTVRKGSPDLTGLLTEENLAGFRVDLCFIGADAVADTGLYTCSQSIARVSRAMIGSARKTILVADSSKFTKTAFVRFVQWQEVDTVIVDDNLDAHARSWLRKAVKEVIEATV